MQGLDTCQNLLQKQCVLTHTPNPTAPRSNPYALRPEPETGTHSAIRGAVAAGGWALLSQASDRAPSGERRHSTVATAL